MTNSKLTSQVDALAYTARMIHRWTCIVPALGMLALGAVLVEFELQLLGLTALLSVVGVLTLGFVAGVITVAVMTTQLKQLQAALEYRNNDAVADLKAVAKLYQPWCWAEVLNGYFGKLKVSELTQENRLALFAELAERSAASTQAQHIERLLLLVVDWLHAQLRCDAQDASAKTIHFSAAQRAVLAQLAQVSAQELGGVSVNVNYPSALLVVKLLHEIAQGQLKASWQCFEAELIKRIAEDCYPHRPVSQYLSKVWGSVHAKNHSTKTKQSIGYLVASSVLALVAITVLTAGIAQFSWLPLSANAFLGLTIGGGVVTLLAAVLITLSALKFSQVQQQKEQEQTPFSDVLNVARKEVVLQENLALMVQLRWRMHQMRQKAHRDGRTAAPPVPAASPVRRSSDTSRLDQPGTDLTGTPCPGVESPGV